MPGVGQSWVLDSAQPTQASVLSSLSLDVLICRMGVKHEVPRTKLDQDNARGSLRCGKA